MSETNDIRKVMPPWRINLAIGVGVVGAMFAGYGVASESWWAVAVGAVLLACSCLIAMPLLKLQFQRHGWRTFFPPARRGR